VSNLIVVISGKSGVGKDTIIGYLGLKRYPSITTRPQRQGEIEGVNYHFVSEKNFLDLKKAGELMDYVNISGYYYGFPIQGLVNEYENGDYALNMVAESGLIIKKIIGDTLLVYLSFPDKETQIERLKSRGMSDYEIGIRLRDDPNEDIMPIYYDVGLVNYNSQKTANQILELVKGLKNGRKNGSFFERKRVFGGRGLPNEAGLSNSL
jgi:guanylate kinase